MNNPSEIIANNWRALQSEVAEAAEKAGRSADELKIVGVSKYVDAETTRRLRQAGCHDLGGSRPQALWEKAEELSDLDCRWHMIGHLQRNKVRRSVPWIALLHSLDSTRLAQSISAELEKHCETAAGVEREGDRLACLLEVNISNDANKAGFLAEQVAPAMETIAALPGLKISGLMAMAHFGSTPSEARHEFADLRQLRDRLVADGLPAGVRLDELSMGMSGDFPQAIQEGATIVRVGSRLFEGLEQ